MEHGNQWSFSPADHDGENRARDYVSALRGVNRFSALVLYVYPFLLLFLVAFLMGNLYGLAAIFAIYWLMFFFLESRRYAVDIKMKNIQSDFRDYVLHSPSSQGYLKFSVIPMLMFFGEITGYYVPMTAYEGAALIILVLVILVATLYSNPWLKGQIRQARPLEDKEINSRIWNIIQNNGINGANLKIIDGKTFEVANAYTVGMLKPAICITDYALENFNHDETVAILTHELSHLMRRDTLRMAIPALSAAAAIIIMVGIVAFWSTEPGMVPFLQKVMPTMIQVWVLTALAGFLFLPSFIMWRGELRADKFAAQYSDTGVLIQALVKLQHLNRLPVFSISRRATQVLARINRIRGYGKSARL